MNKRNRLVILSIIIFIAIIIIAIEIFSNINIETEGEYSGYQLILTASYGGTGFDGQQLKSGKAKKIYNISEKDIFYESFSDDTWLLNPEIEDKDEEEIPTTIGVGLSEILQIIEFGEKTVKIKNDNKIYDIKYNRKTDIDSNYVVYDGPNYSYTIRIIKK